MKMANKRPLLLVNLPDFIGSVPVALKALLSSILLPKKAKLLSKIDSNSSFSVLQRYKNLITKFVTKDAKQGYLVQKYCSILVTKIQ